MAIVKGVVRGGAVVLAGALFVTLIGVLLHQTGKGSNHTPLSASVKGTADTAQGTLPHAFMKLDTYPDSMAGEHGKSGGSRPNWVSYGSTTDLRMPAHSLVTMTINQYDTGGPITNPYFASVHGTVGGTMQVNGKTRTKLDPNEVGHTFTLHAAPTNQDPLFVSVPLPAQSNSAKNAAHSMYPAPFVVTFSFITNGPGKYVWNCEFPCGDGYENFAGPMSTRGYMSGTLTVT